MFSYKHIYETLGTAGLPLLQGSQGKRTQSRAEATKHALMLSCCVFFFGFTKLGMFNKIFFCLCKFPIFILMTLICRTVTSQSMVFVHKCNFYQGIIDDLATSMTLTGQEARLQVRYHLPDHPQIELYEQLCDEYKKLSEKQLQKHLDEVDVVQRAKRREKRLDDDFTKRLALMAEQDEQDSVSNELPQPRRPQP